MHTRSAGIVAALIALPLIVGGCGGGNIAGQAEAGAATSSTAPSADTANSALPRIDLPVEQGETVEGLVDVDGHDIYARCSGTGSPTVVYFTGWGRFRASSVSAAIRAIESRRWRQASDLFLNAATRGAARL